MDTRTFCGNCGEKRTVVEKLNLSGGYGASFYRWLDICWPRSGGCLSFVSFCLSWRQETFFDQNFTATCILTAEGRKQPESQPHTQRRSSAAYSTMTFWPKTETHSKIILKSCCGVQALQKKSRKIEQNRVAHSSDPDHLRSFTVTDFWKSFLFLKNLSSKFPQKLRHLRQN